MTGGGLESWVFSLSLLLSKQISINFVGSMDIGVSSSWKYKFKLHIPICKEILDCFGELPRLKREPWKGSRSTELAGSCSQNFPISLLRALSCQQVTGTAESRTSSGAK